MKNWTELNYSNRSNVLNYMQQLGIWRVPWRTGLSTADLEWFMSHLPVDGHLVSRVPMRPPKHTFVCTNEWNADVVRSRGGTSFALAYEFLTALKCEFRSLHDFLKKSPPWETATQLIRRGQAKVEISVEGRASLAERKPWAGLVEITLFLGSS